MTTTINIWDNSKIIDSHLHFGTIANFDMPETMLINTMTNYKIKFGVVSNIELIEFESDGTKATNSLGQIEGNQKTIDLIKKYPDKLKGLFWIKPNSEGLTDNVKKFIIDNKNYFVGLKIHPFHSNLAVTDDKYKPYFDFAKERGLIVAVHTATDVYSKSDFVYEVAKIYSDVNFILVHMDMASYHEKAIQYVKEAPNLYGDTTWFTQSDILLEAIKTCGSNKILFGSDNPVSGEKNYDAYNKVLQRLYNNLSKEDYENVTYKNCNNLMKLNLNL